jgi:hypothetical protein
MRAVSTISPLSTNVARRVALEWGGGRDESGLTSSRPRRPGYLGQSTLGPLVDCNVHLWDQRDNPVFWLTDRTLMRDLIGNYDSLPDVYTLGDYERETARSTSAASCGQTRARIPSLDHYTEDSSGVFSGASTRS